MPGEFARGHDDHVAGYRGAGTSSNICARRDLLGRRKDGATISEIVDAIGWQPHSVRGAISGTLKKKLGLTVERAVVDDRGRVYRIVGRG